MTENSSSNFNLNREDSFSNLTISDIMGERSETSSISSQLDTKEDVIAINKKVEELELKINKSEEEKRVIKKDFDLLKKGYDELALKLKKLNEEKACYLKVSNKWKWICTQCCEKICVIHDDRPKATCFYGYGFVQIINDTNIKYNCKNIYRDNKEGIITAENYFKKPESTKLCLNCATYSLYYYEIKLIIEKSRPVIEIGFWYIYLCLTSGYIYYYDNVLNKDKFINLSSFSFNNEDIIGCGVVYPPPNINNNKLPYIFFTKNGELIGKAIEIKGKYDLNPFVRLKCCSIEANFGEDLHSKPFKYDVSNHYVVKEFYEEKEFSDE